MPSSLKQAAPVDTLRGMHLHPALPESIDELKTLLLAQSAQLAQMHALISERDWLKQSRHTDQEEIKRLTLLIDKFKRLLFGRKSEKLAQQIDQLELELEELHIKQGEQISTAASTAPTKEPSAPQRRPLPAHLPREIREHLPTAPACPDCGAAWQRLGEEVREVLEYVPARFKVVRHVRPKFRCACCETIVQAPAPSRPIARSYAGPGLLSQVMVSKYQDHLPLYRQSQIYAREGVDLPESTLGDWVGGVHSLLRPLLEALRAHVFATEKLHADDTPIAVLMPGHSKTRQGRLWVYVRDDRPAGLQTPPAVWFRYSPDRKGIHPQTHLQTYKGILQADAYAGYNAIYATGRVVEAGCWAHARRKFHDTHLSRPTPVTTYVLAQIAVLYKIEAGIRGSPIDHRREVRQASARPIVDALRAWLMEQSSTLSLRSVTMDAITYVMNQWQALTRYLDDGRIEIDNNAAERALRGVALGRKNYLFLGSDAGGERAATMYSLLGTARLNNINPQAYLQHVLGVIADYPVNRVSELLPWNLALEKTY